LVQKINNGLFCNKVNIVMKKGLSNLMSNKTGKWSVFVLIGVGLFLLASGSCLPSHRLPATPQGWTQGREGWIPPLPQGMDKPGPLSQAEWDKVLSLASKDTEITSQYKINNITSTMRLWVEYDGDAGWLYNSDSLILSGKANLPAKYTWYYPAINFYYHNKITIPGYGDSAVRTVGVDIKTGKIIFTYNGFIPPEKR
jgi:hypothetical protein